MTDQLLPDRFTLRAGRTMFQMPRLTRELIADLLAVEPRAVIRRDEDEQPIGVDLPMPDGVIASDGSETRTALLGDRVGRDRYGCWLVVHAP